MEEPAEGYPAANDGSLYGFGRPEADDVLPRGGRRNGWRLTERAIRVVRDVHRDLLAKFGRATGDMARRHARCCTNAGPESVRRLSQAFCPGRRRSCAR